MKKTGFALVVGCAALLLSGVTGGCGGITATLAESDGGPDGHSSSGSGSGGSSSGSGGSTSGSGGSTSGSGGSSSSGSGGSSTSSSGGSSSSGSGGSSSSSGGSSSSSGGSSSGGPNSGTIYFEQCSGSTLCSTPMFDFYAGFYSQATSQNCTITTSGSCSSYTCTPTTTQPTGVSAGTLTLSGGSIGAGVTVLPGTNGTYSYTASGSRYSAGQTLTVQASGGTVPAFGPHSVVAPGLPGLILPSAGTAGYTIPTSSDLAVAWTGGTAGAVLIFEGTANGSQTYFTCEWQASLGKGDVPAAILKPLAGQTTGYLIYGQYASTSFTAGAYSISEAALPFSGGAATFQ